MKKTDQGATNSNDKNPALPSGTPRYDKRTDMFFYGKSLDELAASGQLPEQPPGEEMKDKNGKVIGVTFTLGGKKE